MAASSLLLSHLRRSRRLFSISSISLVRQFHRIPNSDHPIPPRHHHQHYPTPRLDSFTPYSLFPSRSFSVPSDNESAFKGFNLDGDSANDSVAYSDSVQSGIDEVSDALISGAAEGPGIPVRALISLLDGFHDVTGLPWWAVIVSSTVAFRLTLFPILVFQLKKIQRISELFPKLPAPFPPPLSGKSYIRQFSLFRKERKAIGCPSFLWFTASFCIQVPCFLLWMTTVRSMSLDHHPGFDCGGALWFQNLTELPHGALGLILPTLISGFHFLNVKVSFGTSSIGKMEGLFGLLAEYYKKYLYFMTLPLFFIAQFVPQGSLVYWVTNSSLSVIQQLCLKHSAIRATLGLPDKNAPKVRAKAEEVGTTEIQSLDLPSKGRRVSVQNLLPKELLALSVQLLSKGHRERAIPLLKLALDKDPEYVRAMILMGQTLLQKELLGEAADYFERAISKLIFAGQPTEVEEVDLLILSSQWAGVAYIRQGKMAEGIEHLERIANMNEPEDPPSKAHYFDGLILFSSALFNEGRKAEAAKYLRLAAAYNPEYNELLKQCENDDDDFSGDLANSRRADY